MSQEKTRTMVGYTWKEWSKHFCKSWYGHNGDSVRKVQCPEVFTSRKQMGKWAKDGVKVRITIEEKFEKIKQGEK